MLRTALTFYTKTISCICRVATFCKDRRFKDRDWTWISTAEQFSDFTAAYTTIKHIFHILNRVPKIMLSNEAHPDYH